MKLRKFLQSIQELKPTKEELLANNLPLSVQDDWEIDILNDEFQAFSGIYDQMVFCLDTITLFPGLEQLQKTDENAPRPFKIWGFNSFYSFHYAYNYMTEEAVLLDDILSPEPAIYCAASGAKLLDCLFIVAQYFRMRLFEPDKAEQEKDDWISKVTTAAGGEKYHFHCQILIG
jgi:hypothetical protein